VLTDSETKLFVTEQLAARTPTLADFDGMAEGGDFAVFWEPPSIDERIVNQSATFCVMSSPTARFDDWLAQHEDAGRSLTLSPQAKADARRHLDLSGITERLLFPDLTGLARWIARYYQ
jgi:hypothetical protein